MLLSLVFLAPVFAVLYQQWLAHWLGQTWCQSNPGKAQNIGTWSCLRSSSESLQSWDMFTSATYPSHLHPESPLLGVHPGRILPQLAPLSPLPGPGTDQSFFASFPRIPALAEDRHMLLHLAHRKAESVLEDVVPVVGVVLSFCVPWVRNSQKDEAQPSFNQKSQEVPRRAPTINKDAPTRERT